MMENSEIIIKPEKNEENSVIKIQTLKNSSKQNKKSRIKLEIKDVTSIFHIQEVEDEKNALKAIDETFEDELNVNVKRVKSKNAIKSEKSHKTHIKSEPEESFELHLPSDQPQISSLQCPTCLKVFSSTKSLTQHQNTPNIHFRPEFKCLKCSKVFKQRGFYARHNCATLCTLCDIEFDSHRQLNAHQRSVHSRELNIAWMWCDLCGLRFSKKFRLALHMSAKHIDKRVEFFVCDHDGKVFAHKDRLYRHMTSHLANIECRICGKHIKPRTIWSHMKKTHETERRFGCGFCEKFFKTAELRRHHENTHEKRFVCRVCGRKMATKYALRQHAKVHDNPDTYKCDVCGRKFNHQNNLKSHVKTHDKHREKKHRCTRCDYSSYKSDHLRHHMKMHERIDEKFKDVKNAIKCPKCPTLCKNKTLLGMHIRYVHPDVKFQCDLCGRFIKMKSNVKHHLRKFHKLIVK